MKEILTDAASKVAEKANQAVDTAQYFTSGEFWNDFVMGGLKFIFIAIVALVLFNALFNGVYRFIRGLDVAAIGGVFTWFAIKIHDIPVVCQMSKPLLLLGLGMIVLGILIFIVFRWWGKRKVRREANAQLKKAAKKEDRKAQEAPSIEEFTKPEDIELKLE